MVFSVAMTRPETLVIVNYYDARPIDTLYELVDQLKKCKYRQYFDILIVVNSVDLESDQEKCLNTGVEFCIRENTGLNLGAWQHGWQEREGYRYYIFLQDDCKILKDKWYSRYITLLADRKNGYIGESYQRHRTWERIRKQWEDVYSDYVKLSEKLGIPLSYSPSHIQTVAMGCRHQVLKETGGFVIGASKSAAVAGEILTSVRAVHLGYRNRQTALSSFSFISHPQWQRSYNFRSMLRDLV